MIVVNYGTESSSLIDVNRRSPTRRRRSLVVAMVVVVVVAFCITIGVVYQPSPDRSNGSDNNIQSMPNINNIKACPSSGTKTITSGGRNRNFELYVSPGASSSSSIIFVWHGISSSPSKIENLVKMKPYADDNSWVVVYPVGVGFLSSFNGRGCCDNSPKDVEFAKDIIEYLKVEGCGNANKVYTTGFSNGGFMSYELGCSEGGLFEAVAVHSGLIGIYNHPQNLPDWETYTACSDNNGPPFLAIHGTGDVVVPINGGKDPNPFSSANWYSFSDSVDIWRKRQNCRTGSDTERQENPTTTCIINSECKVEKCTVTGLKHDWSNPTLDNNAGYVDSTKLITDFFKDNGA